MSILLQKAKREMQNVVGLCFPDRQAIQDEQSLLY